MTDIKVYTLDEVADILKVTKRTLYNYVKAGKLPAVKIGKYWRVSSENLNAFISTGFQSGSSPNEDMNRQEQN